MSLFFFSFCDSERPEGQRFLGACIIEGGDTGDFRTDSAIGIREAWRRGCNPGGEVMMQPVAEEARPYIDERWIGRLLSRAECEEFDRDVVARRQAAGAN